MKIEMRHQKSSISLQRVATDKEWDLALLKTPDPVNLSAINWPSKQPNIEAGSLLVAKDKRGRALWNVATDSPRAVTKKRSLGPLRDKSIISEHRAPYPVAIRHALPLIASDVGTPVFDQNGTFVGIHIARFSRTMGMIIPSSELEKQCAIMIKNAQDKEAKTTAP